MGVLLLPIGALVLLAPFMYLFEFLKPLIIRYYEIFHGVEFDENGNPILPE